MRHIVWILLLIAALLMVSCRENGRSNQGDATNSSTLQPDAPSNLIAMAGLKAITCTWDPPSASSIAGYDIYRDGTIIGSTLNSSYTDTNVVSGKTYTYSVAAYSASGSTSTQIFTSATITMPTLYEQCFYPDYYPETWCPDESCVPSGLTGRVFNEWKSAYASRQNLTTAEFENRVGINDVYQGIYTPYGVSPTSYQLVYIRYVKVFDWVRIPRGFNINLGIYPLAQDPTDQEIRQDINPAWAFDDIDVRKVVPLSVAENSMKSCDAIIVPDYCRIYFYRGSFFLPGTGVIDWAANQCKHAIVDLSTGNLIACANGGCYIVQ